MVAMVVMPILDCFDLPTHWANSHSYDYNYCINLLIQFLLGIFYYIKAVVLFEDLLKTQFVGIQHKDDTPYWNNKTKLPLIEYFSPEDVDVAYQQAA